MTDKRPDFDVGDYVVCVDDGRCSLTRRTALAKKGDVLRVGRMWPPETTDSGQWGFDEMGSDPSSAGHHCHRFRKIDRADEAWTRELRETIRQTGKVDA